MSELRERVRRALLLVPLVAGAKEGIEVEVLAERLGIAPEALAEELDFLMMVGRPPFSPADFLDLYIEEGRVHAALSLSLDRPLRLTHDEALALCIGAQATTQNMGPAFAAELEGALSRLEEAMTETERERYLALREQVLAGVTGAGDLHSRLREAIEARQALSVDYFSASEDERRERTVHPHAIHAHEGYWYLLVTEAGEVRHLRLDRIGALRPSGDAGAAEQLSEEECGRRIREGFFQGASESLARVRVAAPKARFAAEKAGDAELHWQEDGSVEIALRLVSPAWVSAWVLSFAPHATVLEPPFLAKKVREDARRALAAYA